MLNSRLKSIALTSIRRIQALELKVVYLEQSVNQLSILQDTLTSIMEESRKLER